MGKSSAPAAPDYAGAAQVEADSSREVTNAQTWANRPDVTTPWGSQTWNTTPTIDPSSGDTVNRWSSNIQLSPDQQQSLDSQQRIQAGRSSAAEGLLGQASGQFGQEIDYGSMPSRTGNVDPFGFSSGFNTEMQNTAGDWRQRAQDATWEAQKPMLDDRRSDVENQLSNQGLSRGSEAWGREMRNLDDSEARARLLSVDAGRQEAGQLFNQDAASGNFTNNALTQQANTTTQLGNFQNLNRQQGIAEQMQRRGYSLNELNALLSGQQVNMPQMPGAPQAAASQGVNALGVAQGQYGAATDAANVSNANTASTNSAAAMAAMMMFSDIRLKEDVQVIGLLRSGIPVVHYRYRGLPSRYIGVIAQDVLRIIPEAVVQDPSGFYKVDYSKVH